MQKITVIAAEVNTRFLTLYLDDGSEYKIKQGDPRLQHVLNEILPYMRERQSVQITVPEYVEENIYTDMEKASGLVKFFRVARDVVSKLWGSNADHVAPMGPIGIVDEKGLAIEEAIAEINANAQPHTSQSHDEDLTTMVAVVDNKAIIPDVQNMRLQIDNAIKGKNIKGVVSFFSRLANMEHSTQHTANDLMRFIERGDLPLADSGDILVYKVLKRREEGYVDLHTKRVAQQVGDLVCMSRKLVDPDRKNECSQGLHIARKEYLYQFTGDVCVLAVIRPEDVIAVPSYDPNKMRVCAYHIIAELTPEMYAAIRASDQNITSIPDGAKLIASALKGHYDAPKRRVEIMNHQQETQITELTSVDKAPKSHPKVVPAKALDLKDLSKDSTKNSPVVDPKKVAKKVQKSKTRAQVAHELYLATVRSRTMKDFDRNIEKFLVFKKRVKVSWASLGFDEIPTRESLLNSMQGSLNEAPSTSEISKPDKKRQGDFAPSKVELAISQYKKYLKDPTDRNKEKAIQAKKATKKSWDYLGIPDLTKK